MLKADPKKPGTTSGLKVSTQFSREKMMNRGTMVTCRGSIMVLRTTRNSTSRPRKRIREKPNAPRDDEMVVPMMFMATI